jgi:capsular polysaccharide biosynthesis protein
MESHTKSSPQFDALSLIRLFIRWRIQFLVAIVLAAGLAFLVTRFIDPLYESHAILMPSSSSNRDKQLEDLSYGWEIHSERLMQLLKSETLLDSLEKKFDLAKSWELDRSDRRWYDKMAKLAAERIQFHKTQYSSVVVSVADEDPERAAAIANEATRLVNIINADIMRAAAMDVLRSVESDFNKRDEKLASITDSVKVTQDQNSDKALELLESSISNRSQRIKQIRDSIDRIRVRYNIFDLGYQVNVLNEELAEARSLLLQESGALEVLPEHSRADDTLLMRTRARKAGAQQRVKFFEQQLHDLSTINASYTSLLSRLEVEEALMNRSRQDLGSLRESIEPRVSSRGLYKLESDLDFDEVQYRDLRRKYQNALSNYFNPVPVAFVVSHARPSYEKIYPKTLLSMILAVLGAVFMTGVMVVLLEQFSANRKA